MMIQRMLKVFLVLCVGVMALAYAAHNLLNWPAMQEAVGYTLGLEGHDVYTVSFVPPLEQPIVVMAFAGVILGGEILAGVLSIFGALRLWAARYEGRQENQDAKWLASLGLGFALFVWFGIFIVVGGSVFQMWQTDLGSGALQDAFHMAAMSFLTLIYVSQEDGWV